MMKKKLWISAILLVLLLGILAGSLAAFTPAAYAEEDATPQYKLTWDVMAYGSDHLSGDHYAMDSTIGQTAVIPMHSAHYRLQNGYWGGWWPTIKTFLPNFLRNRH